MDVNANYYRSTTLYVSGSTINTSQSDINTSTISNKSRKRKRDDQSIEKSLNTSMKSMSQLSISQAAVPKKTKRSVVETMFSNK
jgi:hypothetical protein